VAESTEPADDLAVDACASYPRGNGRHKEQFRSCRALAETLLAWRAEGRRDVWVTWGATPPEVRDAARARLAAAGAVFTTPAFAEPSTRGSVLLTAGAGAAVVALALSGLVPTSTDASGTVDASAEAEREAFRLQQMDLMMGAAKHRAFLDADDPDAAVRLESVAAIGQFYPDDERAVPVLVKRLGGDADARVRLAALRGLKRLPRPLPQTAARALQAARDDADPRVRTEARYDGP